MGGCFGKKSSENPPIPMRTSSSNPSGNAEVEKDVPKRVLKSPPKPRRSRPNVNPLTTQRSAENVRISGFRPYSQYDYGSDLNKHQSLPAIIFPVESSPNEKQRESEPAISRAVQEARSDDAKEKIEFQSISDALSEPPDEPLGEPLEQQVCKSFESYFSIEGYEGFPCCSNTLYEFPLTSLVGEERNVTPVVDTIYIYENVVIGDLDEDRRSILDDGELQTGIYDIPRKDAAEQGKK